MEFRYVHQKWYKGGAQCQRPKVTPRHFCKILCRSSSFFDIWDEVVSRKDDLENVDFFAKFNIWRRGASCCGLSCARAVGVGPAEEKKVCVCFSFEPRVRNCRSEVTPLQMQWESEDSWLMCVNSDVGGEDVADVNFLSSNTRMLCFFYRTVIYKLIL